MKFIDFDKTGKRKGGRPRGIDPRPPEERPVVWGQLYPVLLQLVRGLQDAGPLQDLRELAAAVVMQCEMQLEWSSDSMPDADKLRDQNGATARARAVASAHLDLRRVGVPVIREAAQAVMAGDVDQLDLLREYLDRLESYLRTGPVRTAWTEKREPAAPAGDQAEMEAISREEHARLWNTIRSSGGWTGRVGPKKGADGW